ncbi:MAG TPA: trimeric intracellular cation channel family protein [Jiangellales bacterium]|nr:trimeric intracellular cation channel family protein [Jiangellales bacterium]
MVVTSPLLQALLDALGTLVFAITGGIVGVRKGLDVFGVLVLAAATGLGGGYVRDLSIGAIPPAALDSPLLLGAALLGGLVAFLLHVPIGRVEPWVGVLDALGLGLFAVVGAVKAADFGVDPVPAALLGMLSGVGGGVIRDVLAGRVPVVLRQEIYAVPALLGASLAVLAYETGTYGTVTALGAVGAASALRVLAMMRGWNAWRAPGADQGPSTRST